MPCEAQHKIIKNNKRKVVHTMQERIFKDNYELFEMMLKEINQWRKNFQSNSVDDELLAPIFYMYDVI